MKRLFSILIALLASAVPATAADPALTDSLSKMVKLYGAGGFKGLEAYGTGFLASPDGHVVTSWGPLLDAEPVTAVLADGRRFDAKLAGADPGLGIAVLKLDGSALPYFDLAEAADAAPGDRVYALSNMFRVASGDEPASVMHGVVVATAPLSARRGRFEVTLEAPVYFIDAVTNNPGAAGGVVTGPDGRLVGVIGRELRGDEAETWINYAIPATAIRDRVSAVFSGEAVAGVEPAAAPGAEAPRRLVDLGIVTVPDVTARTPAYVTETLSGSAADVAGLTPEDLVLFASGKPVRSIRELSQALSRAESGEPVDLVVRRSGRLVPVRLVIP